MYKNGKILGLINILDLLIILAALVTAVILAPNFISSTKADNDITLYFTLELPQTTQTFADQISIGDAISDNTRNDYYGVIDKIEVVPSKVLMTNSLEGAFVETEAPDQVDVRITVKCNGTETEKGLLAEGKDIKIGQSMILKGKGYVCAGFVIELRTEGGSL